MMYVDADVCMGGVSRMWTKVDKGGGVKSYQIFADVLYGRPLTGITVFEGAGEKKRREEKGRGGNRS